MLVTRQVRVLRGPPEQTEAQLAALCAGVPREHVRRLVPGADLSAALGQSWSVVVLELAEGFDADALAIAQGCVHEGGTLVLRGPQPLPPAERLAAWPHKPTAVGNRLWGRVEQAMGPSTLVEDRFLIGPSMGCPRSAKRPSWIGSWRCWPGRMWPPWRS